VSGTVTANQGAVGTAAWKTDASATTQPVSWSNLLTVGVSNLPATQPVSGSVSVSNLPSTQNVACTSGCSTGGSADVTPVVAATDGLRHTTVFAAGLLVFVGAAALAKART